MRESAESLAELQRIIDRSAATAGRAMRRNFIGGGWAMSNEEFVAFWGEGRMASVATVSANGRVHAVPLDVRLVGGRFYIPTFPDSRRLQDHAAHPRCAITSWDGPYRAVIVYGRAREVARDPAERTAETATEQGYAPGETVTIEVTPTRIYAIRPPDGHHAASPVPSLERGHPRALTAEQASFLEAHRVGHLATVDERGRPHNVPVCFAVVGGRIVIAIDEKPKRVRPEDLRRVRNVRANPSVCLVVDDYDEDWTRLAWMQVRGMAALLEDAAERIAALAALRARYPQYRAMTLESRPILAITLERIVSWKAKG